MKRGQSGLSMLIGVDKPLEMSSHDVVNRCRRVFNEKRVGHTGTLDPMASGAMLMCIGPATRLNPYITSIDKRYRFSVRFGTATDTDDSEGSVIRRENIPPEVSEYDFATKVVESLVGKHMQLPPIYSAIKVDGKRSYKAAREGNIIDLQPRPIEIFDTQLIAITEEEGYPAWEVEALVSKGTYIRSIARDIGNSVGSAAHVGSLRRLSVGSLDVEDCTNLDMLQQGTSVPVIDPVRLLGFQMMFVPDDEASLVMNGSSIPGGSYQIYRNLHTDQTQAICSCSAAIMESEQPPSDGEIISVIAENKLVGLYRFEKDSHLFKPQCIFSVGVLRGGSF